MGLSKKQEDAIEWIKRMEEHFGVRLFVKDELFGITQHTMYALVNKGYLEYQAFEGMPYYRFRGGI